VSCCRPYTVHVCTVVVGTWSGKGTVSDAFGVETEADFLRVVLSYWQGARNDLGLVSVVPTMHVGVGIILASRLLSLQVCVVKDLGRICSGLAFLQWGGHCSGGRDWVQYEVFEVESGRGRVMATGA
jgi:hypothetical protein